MELPGLESAAAPPSAPVQNPIALNPAVNINDLFQKLVASGFVKTQEKKNQDQSNNSPVHVNVIFEGNALSNGKG